jgi:hemerythrin-like domain-containing protein
MTLHDRFVTEHKALRQQVTEIRSALSAKSTPKVQELFSSFQEALRRHLHEEDSAYYRVLDDGRRVTDRGLMHGLRNDHAGVIFALESLMIRLRKPVPLPEWEKRFSAMIDVLLPHFDREEKELFPQAEKLLTPEQTKAILEEIERIKP